MVRMYLRGEYKKLAEVAQLVEHSPEERGVTSSTLVLGTENKNRSGGFYIADEQKNHSSLLWFL